MPPFYSNDHLIYITVLLQSFPIPKPIGLFPPAFLIPRLNHDRNRVPFLINVELTISFSLFYDLVAESLQHCRLFQGSELLMGGLPDLGMLLAADQGALHAERKRINLIARFSLDLQLTIAFPFVLTGVPFLEQRHGINRSIMPGVRRRKLVDSKFMELILYNFHLKRVDHESRPK